MGKVPPSLTAASALLGCIVSPTWYKYWSSASVSVFKFTKFTISTIRYVFLVVDILTVHKNIPTTLLLGPTFRLQFVVSVALREWILCMKLHVYVIYEPYWQIIFFLVSSTTNFCWHIRYRLKGIVRVPRYMFVFLNNYPAIVWVCHDTC